MDYDVKDIGLAKEGVNKIEWAGKDMLVLEGIRNDFSKIKPFKGRAVGACLHVTSETANLMIALKSGGADVFLCASNPLSTQDDVAASLVKDYGISVFAIKGEDNETYYKHINSVLDNKPQVSMDDGADLISTVHSSRKELIGKIIGGTEETTTGV
ncbi:MAG: adenosylhomocysteinase, partial [Candidatus Atribacteria bacterium]|nr:adenosylhomocysteinase [Candidatus Atribacteria bacterium]